MLYSANQSPLSGGKWFAIWEGGSGTKCQQNVSKEQTPRAALELAGAQLGDSTFGDSAGGDIYKGADSDSLIELLKYQIDKDSQFRMLDFNVREARQNQVDMQHTELLSELRMQRWLLISGLLLIILVLVLAL